MLSLPRLSVRVLISLTDFLAVLTVSASSHWYVSSPMNFPNFCLSCSINTWLNICSCTHSLVFPTYAGKRSHIYDWIISSDLLACDFGFLWISLYLPCFFLTLKLLIYALHIICKFKHSLFPLSFLATNILISIWHCSAIPGGCSVSTHTILSPFSFMR